MIETRLNEEEIFKIAHEISSPQTRHAYLEQVCGDDAALHQRVLALLQVVEQEQSFLERPAAAPVETVPPSPLREKSGDTIGPYKLLEQIGEGGMGLVYMAQQTQPVKRKVALKVIKPGMDSKQVIARFEAERQALAMMDHPHIARVLDAGTTQCSRPYFVMELVRGMSITDYCDKQRIHTRERLELFLDVCHAVQHAHLKGIIHRDLKPSNVLITLHDGTAVVKVIDFGVAKALNQELTERTLFTQFSQMVGTPLYMSPEQAELSGLDVDTRTDVYSLGVLLYELLTGTTPFDKEALSKAGFDEMRRMIREVEPETVSARIAKTRRVGSAHQSSLSSLAPRPQPLAPRLSEIDWIVMKALEKDRSRRYESASSLAADIQRYLSDEPVLACPPTAMYRFQKFARKHKPALATAAAIALCLLLGTTVSAWQAVRATTAEAQANANATKAQEKEQEAIKQRDEVKTLYDQLAAKEQQLQRTLYASNMNLAKSAWDAGDVKRFNELLDQHRPKAGELDLRGLEWHYLDRLSHTDLLTLDRHSGGTPSPQSVAFSPDGKRLANYSGNGVILVRDSQTGQELLTLKGGGLCLAFSPDGTRLASGAGTWDENKKTYVAGEVKVWDSHSGQLLLTCKGHTLRVSSVAFSANGKRLASASQAWNVNSVQSAEIKIFDALTAEELLSVKGHTQPVSSVAFSPDGKRLATADWNETKVWDTQTGNELFSSKGSGQCVAFSPDGKRLACAGGDSTAKVWDVQTGKVLLSLKIDALAVAFSPDGKRLATAHNELQVWDAETGDAIRAFKGHTATVNSVVFSPDGLRLSSGSSDRTVKVWDATASQEARTLKNQSGNVRGVSVSPDGNQLALGRGVEVKICDAHSGQEFIALQGHTMHVQSFAYSPDGKRLATASSDQTVKVWDAQAGQELLTFMGHTGEVVCVAFSPDGTRLVSCTSLPGGVGRTSDRGEPGEVKVWDARSGRELLTLEGHRRYVNYVAFSPDGKRLATLSRDNTLKVWDAQTGQEVHTLKVLVSDGGSVAFSPDNKRLASSSHSFESRRSSEVKVFDVQTGEEVLAIKGTGTRVAYSPDGKRLVTGAGPHGPASMGELKVWDAENGQELLTLNANGESSSGLAFSADGHRVIGIGSDGAARIWDATPLPEKP